MCAIPSTTTGMASADAQDELEPQRAILPIPRLLLEVFQSRLIRGPAPERRILSERGVSARVEGRVPSPESRAPSLDNVIPHIPDRLDDGRHGENGGVKGEGRAVGGVVDAGLA